MARLVANPVVCNGCKICELICSFWHEGEFNWRSLHDPLPEGPSKGDTVRLEELSNRYYSLRKWDPHGIPTVACLKELDLEAEIEDLAQMGIEFNR
jgi:aldehyde:ferredoxin oxidoreductase